jgi:predicted ATPase
LAHLLALYQNPPRQLLLFDEPEQGIYPGALESLATEFKDSPSAGRGQVILTTHSPEMLDFFPVEALRVVELVEDETRISRVSAEQQEAVREALLSTGELLTVQEARSDSDIVSTE